jgi:hypothetical protein
MAGDMQGSGGGMKNAPHGERIAAVAAVVLFALGAVLLVHPSTLTALT